MANTKVVTIVTPFGANLLAYLFSIRSINVYQVYCIDIYTTTINNPFVADLHPPKTRQVPCFQPSTNICTPGRKKSVRQYDTSISMIYHSMLWRDMNVSYGSYDTTTLRKHHTLPTHQSGRLDIVRVWPDPEILKHCFRHCFPLKSKGGWLPATRPVYWVSAVTKYRATRNISWHPPTDDFRRWPSRQRGGCNRRAMHRAKRLDYGEIATKYFRSRHHFRCAWQCKC